ncbi:zinc-ribbon domain-containing protein [Methanoregula sp.]|uniref:zinc-ribbon domain-containing protein n=1 Tax=Methanoregula sp. TaxID=2052170 RepID=UPI00236EDD14|nr:zinc-ribbon domain-containing protein [Methanoregula sp.]MDD1685983.1 hypothetical protein [Methanoregula sp.]
MAYPNLYNDESIILNAQNIKVKSVSFEAVLTTRRLILVDSKKHLIAPQEILLATLRDIEPGENAIRDPTIALSIITNTGATRQMILTFSKTSGERQRECDEWVKALRHQITAAVQHTIMPDIQAHEEAPVYPANTPVQPYHTESVASPVSHSPKRKIEIARPGPMKKIIETAPSMPQPVETTSLPTGSFCNRCGSRVPPESAFCNKCGTPVVTEADLAAQVAAPYPVSSVPQVHVTTPPTFGTGATDRPIEDVIHSIEPLIEDSVPRRREPAPLVPKQHGQQQPAVTTPPAAPEQPVAVPVAAPGTASPVAPATPAVPQDPQSSQPGTTDVKWPVIGSPETAAPVEPAGPPTAAPAAAAPAAPPITPPPATPSKKKWIVVGGIAIAIIVIIAAVVIFANPLGGNTGPTVATPTPYITTLVTPAPTTTLPQVLVPDVTETVEPIVTAATTATGAVQLVIPDSGVWVRVTYISEYEGTVGTPGTGTSVTGSGEKLFQIPTSEGIVVASFQKLDGSSDKLTVEVYKNGNLVSEKSTVTPKGVVEIMADLKTPTPTPTPTKIAVITKTTTASTVNTTGNTTVSTTT